MNQVGMREFRTDLSAIPRRVRENGESFEITNRSKLVAVLKPIQRWEKEIALVDERTFEQRWEEHMRLAEEIGKHCDGEFSAAEAVAEQRRDLADPRYWEEQIVREDR